MNRTLENNERYSEQLVIVSSFKAAMFNQLLGHFIGIVLFFGFFTLAYYFFKQSNEFGTSAQTILAIVFLILFAYLVKVVFEGMIKVYKDLSSQETKFFYGKVNRVYKRQKRRWFVELSNPEGYNFQGYKLPVYSFFVKSDQLHLFKPGQIIKVEETMKTQAMINVWITNQNFPDLVTQPNLENDTLIWDAQKFGEIDFRILRTLFPILILIAIAIYIVGRSYYTEPFWKGMLVLSIFFLAQGIRVLVHKIADKNSGRTKYLIGRIHSYPDKENDYLFIKEFETLSPYSHADLNETRHRKMRFPISADSVLSGLAVDTYLKIEVSAKANVMLKIWKLDAFEPNKLVHHEKNIG